MVSPQLRTPAPPAWLSVRAKAACERVARAESSANCSALVSWARARAHTGVGGGIKAGRRREGKRREARQREDQAHAWAAARYLELIEQDVPVRAREDVQRREVRQAGGCSAGRWRLRPAEQVEGEALRVAEVDAVLLGERSVVLRHQQLQARGQAGADTARAIGCCARAAERDGGLALRQRPHQAARRALLRAGVLDRADEGVDPAAVPAVATAVLCSSLHLLPALELCCRALCGELHKLQLLRAGHEPKVGAQPEQRGVRAHEAHAERVEREHVHARRAECEHPLAQLARCPAREGDGEDGGWRHGRRHEVRHTVRQDARLA